MRLLDAAGISIHSKASMRLTRTIYPQPCSRYDDGSEQHKAYKTLVLKGGEEGVSGLLYSGG